MHSSRNAIFQRRAIRVFEPIEISPTCATNFGRPLGSFLRASKASRIDSSGTRRATHCARLPNCVSASRLPKPHPLWLLPSDIGAWRSTALGQLEWMRAPGFSPEKIAEFERKFNLAKWFFIQGWCNLLGALKWLAFRAINLFKIIGVPPVTRQGLFKWATKSTSLACENLMIAAESFGPNTCPMEGFDARWLGRFLRLSSRDHEIVMVIAIGKKSPGHIDQPQWRRPLEFTVTIL
jgi:hypothetical protein